jgi:hypothetical protein
MEGKGRLAQIKGVLSGIGYKLVKLFSRDERLKRLTLSPLWSTGQIWST